MKWQAGPETSQMREKFLPATPGPREAGKERDGMLKTVFGKYATVASTVVIFVVSGSVGVGWVDPASATVLLGLLGLHAATSKGLIGDKK